MTNLTTQSEAHTLSELNKAYNAYTNELDSFWDNVPGGATAEKMLKVKTAYSNFCAPFYLQAVTPNAEGLFQNYLEITSELAGTENRFMDIVLQDPDIDEEGTVTFDLHLRLIQQKDGSLVRITPEGNRNLKFSKGWASTQDSLCVGKASVSAGAITQTDYENLVRFTHMWKAQEEKFQAEKSAGSTYTNWTYVPVDPKDMSPDAVALREAKKQNLSIIPANTNFSLLIKPVLNVYAVGDVFNVQWGFVPLDLHDFIFIARGVTRKGKTPIANGAKNPSVAGQFVGELPDYTLPAIEGKMPIMPSAVPNVPSLGQAIPTVASVAPQFTPEQLAAAAAQLEQEKVAAAVKFLQDQAAQQAAQQVTI